MTEKIIKTENVEFIYKPRYGEHVGTKAVSNAHIEVAKGEFVVVIGRNGSGKSTFARLLNAILLPTDGAVYIKGINTREEKRLWEIRRTAGMVFQNPDNQIVGTLVDEDVAFGPENLGVDPAKIRKRVDEALETVGIKEYSGHAPHLLSGGQKQRVAIAGILAMRPECIILDEATSMLDPVGRKEVMSVLKKLNSEEEITIVHITHHMNEAKNADRVIVMDNGKVVMEGKPEEVFSKVEEIKSLGLDVPQVTELLYELNKEGIELPLNIIDVDTAFEVLKKELAK